MAAIFISYRRDDKTCAIRLYGARDNALEVFFDRNTESIDLGDTFADRLQDGLEQCRVFLVLIGPGCLSERNLGRLADPKHWVHMEKEQEHCGFVDSLEHRKALHRVLGIRDAAIGISVHPLRWDERIGLAFSSDGKLAAASSDSIRVWPFEVKPEPVPLAPSGSARPTEPPRTSIVVPEVLGLALSTAMERLQKRELRGVAVVPTGTRDTSRPVGRRCAPLFQVGGCDRKPAADQCADVDRFS